MINQVSDCLSYGGKLNEDLFDENGFNEEFKILEKCYLNFGNGKEEYYLEIEFYNFENLEESLNFKISEGNINLKADCEIQKSKEYGTISKCVEKTFYSLDNDKNEFFIKILSIIRKTEKNAK